MNLLCICPIGIGNFILLAPSLQYLKQKKPDTKVTLLALKGGVAAIADRYDFISETITFDATGKIRLTNKIKFLSSLTGKFDLSIAFFPCNRAEYNLLPVLAGIPRRIAFEYHHYRLRSLSFLNTELLTVSNKAHDLEQNFRLLRAIGLEKPKTMEVLPLKLTKDEIEKADLWLNERGLDESVLIGLHPGSSAEHGMDKKRWPAKKFTELCILLGKNSSYRFLIFGGKEEKQLKHEITESIGPLAVSVDTENFFDTAAIIKRCHRFISNDSGLMHTAVACGVPTAAIFGPTDDRRTAPYGVNNLVIRGNEPCSPCWTHDNVGRRENCATSDFRCLERLSAESVCSKLLNWL